MAAAGPVAEEEGAMHRRMVMAAMGAGSRLGQTTVAIAILLVVLLLLIGLAVDAGPLLLARRSLQAAVDAAAHAGAQQVDVAHLRATGQLRLDAAAAADAARAVLAAEGLGDADVAVGAAEVEVLARSSVPVTLLRLAPAVGESFPVEAAAVGVPRARAIP